MSHKLGYITLRGLSGPLFLRRDDTKAHNQQLRDRSCVPRAPAINQKVKNFTFSAVSPEVSSYL